MSAPRSLYPVSDLPRIEKRYKVSDLHELYLAEYGNPKGMPVMICHGGPGSGCRPYFAGYFNPELYRIILLDQRGSGHSTPKGCMKENTTQDLIADMEVVRKDLNIDKWVVCGGSWGSTLALLYAEAHPDCVIALMLRGVFLGRAKDCIDFICDKSIAAETHPTEWAAYKANVETMLSEANLTVDTKVSDDRYIIDASYELLIKGNDETKNKAAASLTNWEKLNSYLEWTDVTEESLSPDGVNMGLTEVSYFKHHCFIKENQILDNLASIAHIPIYIVQGRFDLVCPRKQSVELELAHKKSGGQVIRHDPICGHAGNEPGIIDGLVKSSDHIAASFRLQAVVNYGNNPHLTFASQQGSGVPVQAPSLEQKPYFHV